MNEQEKKRQRIYDLLYAETKLKAFPKSYQPRRTNSTMETAFREFTRKPSERYT